jgi:hypothetical protein
VYKNGTYLSGLHANSAGRWMSCSCKQAGPATAVEHRHSLCSHSEQSLQHLQADAGADEGSRAAGPLTRTFLHSICSGWPLSTGHRSRLMKAPSFSLRRRSSRGKGSARWMLQTGSAGLALLAADGAAAVTGPAADVIALCLPAPLDQLHVECRGNSPCQPHLNVGMSTMDWHSTKVYTCWVSNTTSSRLLGLSK